MRERKRKRSSNSLFFAFRWYAWTVVSFAGGPPSGRSWSKKLARLFITFKEKRADSNGRVYVRMPTYISQAGSRQLSSDITKLKARAAVMQFESARLTLRIAARIRGILWRSFYLVRLEGERTREKWKLSNELCVRTVRVSYRGKFLFPAEFSSQGSVHAAIEFRASDFGKKLKAHFFIKLLICRYNYYQRVSKRNYTN